MKARSNKKLTPEQRLAHIRAIIEHVDHRAMTADGPVIPTLQEMDHSELCEIYRLAGGTTIGG